MKVSDSASQGIVLYPALPPGDAIKVMHLSDEGSFMTESLYLVPTFVKLKWFNELILYKPMNFLVGPTILGYVVKDTYFTHNLTCENYQIGL